jgi:hypothetical protein
MTALAVAIEGIRTLDDIDEISPEIKKNARLTINKAVDKARVLAANEMGQQVNFPASYLRGDRRLKVTKRASGTDLEAILAGRRRPTSLARFVVGGVSRRGGVSVSVKPGSTSKLKRGFILKLKSGASDIAEKSNRGLAVRLKPGESISKAYKPLKLSDGLYLLYGPSVDQVFKSVREDIRPEVLDFMETEFLRLMELNL